MYLHLYKLVNICTFFILHILIKIMSVTESIDEGVDNEDLSREGAICWAREKECNQVKYSMQYKERLALKAMCKLRDMAEDENATSQDFRTVIKDMMNNMVDWSEWTLFYPTKDWKWQGPSPAPDPVKIRN